MRLTQQVMFLIWTSNITLNNIHFCTITVKMFINKSIKFLHTKRKFLFFCLFCWVTKLFFILFKIIENLMRSTLVTHDTTKISEWWFLHCTYKIVINTTQEWRKLRTLLGVDHRNRQYQWGRDEIKESKFIFMMCFLKNTLFYGTNDILCLWRARCKLFCKLDKYWGIELMNWMR